VGGGCPATPFIGAATPDDAGVLAFALSCVPGRTTDTVMVVPQPQTGQVSYGAEGSEYRPLSFLPGLEPVVELERDAEGAVTGRIAGTPSFREGKTLRVDEWLTGLGRHVQDFERISVYSDSLNDLPLLEWATHPVATNPDARLRTIALERGWRILDLFERQ